LSLQTHRTQHRILVTGGRRRHGRAPIYRIARIRLARIGGRHLLRLVADDRSERLVTGMVADKKAANASRRWYLLVANDNTFSLWSSSSSSG
jgi:hypothetical protein